MSAEFMFGIGVNMGDGTNNYAEYASLYWALVFAHTLGKR